MGFRRAFSLIELVIVVVIVGAVAAIAVPRVTSFSDRAQGLAAASHLRRLAGVYTAYHAEFGRWPSDTTHSTCPPPLMGRLTAQDFSAPPAGTRVLAHRFSMDLGSPDQWNRWLGIVTDDEDLRVAISVALLDRDTAPGDVLIVNVAIPEHIGPVVFLRYSMD